MPTPFVPGRDPIRRERREVKRREGNLQIEPDSSKSNFRSMVPNIKVDFQFLRIQAIDLRSAGSVVLESVNAIGFRHWFVVVDCVI
jgi:hypothetical protein